MTSPIQADSASVSDELPLLLIKPSTSTSVCETEPTGCVSTERLSPSHIERSIDEHEQHIKDCAWLMERAYARYEETGCFAARGEADRWRILRDEAVKARSPEAVAELEAARGLA